MLTQHHSLPTALVVLLGFILAPTTVYSWGPSKVHVNPSPDQYVLLETKVQQIAPNQAKDIVLQSPVPVTAMHYFSGFDGSTPVRGTDLFVNVITNCSGLPI